MNDLESTLTNSYAHHATKVTDVDGDVGDVYRRVSRRKNRRRAFTAITSVALIGVGVAGIAAAQGRGSEPLAVGAPADAWYVCDHQLPDGTWMGCVPETPYANPAWECSGPASSGFDGRPRFEVCTAIGEALPADGACVPATAPPTTGLGTVAPAPSIPVGTVAGLCVPATLPTYVTLPPVTNPPTPVTTAPTLDSRGLIALGDSVMKGAAAELTAHGYAVSAGVGTQLGDLIPVVQQLAAHQPLPDVVVIHAGINGPFRADELDALLDSLAEVPNVVMMTVRADRQWIAGNNELIRAADERANVAVIDWATQADNCPGECFYEDDIHLTQVGAQFYVDLIANYTGR